MFQPRKSGLLLGGQGMLYLVLEEDMYMAENIPGHHPLRGLFLKLTEMSFLGKLKWTDPPVTGYISNLLVEFAHTDNVFKIRNRRGEAVREVATLLYEAEILLNAGSFERERLVRQHIGDYTLFMVGLFPEYLKRLKTGKILHHSDLLIDYVKVGKKSYRIVSEFAYGDFRDAAPLFKKLSENFELCILGLGYVKQELDRLQLPEYKRLRRALFN
jgi:hypothetical protein